MTRAAVIALAFFFTAAIVMGGIYIGKKWDRNDELEEDIDTITGIGDAKDNAGDCIVDWHGCVLRHRGE